MFRSLIIYLAAALILGSCASPSVGFRSPSVRQHVNAHAANRPDAPKLKKLGGKRYKLRKPWTVKVAGKVWCVPAGYVCNGITAPDLIKSSLGDGVDRPETWSAVFHDWVFTQKGVSRSQADNAFHELLLAYGVPARKAAMMHAVVSTYSLSKRLR